MARSVENSKMIIKEEEVLMKIEFLKGFKDLTGQLHVVTRAKRHWWSRWVISIDGRSPYDYKIDKVGKFKQVLHKFPGVTLTFILPKRAKLL